MWYNYIILIIIYCKNTLLGGVTKLMIVRGKLSRNVRSVDIKSFSCNCSDFSGISM